MFSGSGFESENSLWENLFQDDYDEEKQENVIKKKKKNMKQKKNDFLKKYKNLTRKLKTNNLSNLKMEFY